MVQSDWSRALQTRWMARDLEYFPSIGSTNHYLKGRLLHENVPLGASVVADAQTEGRGRLGRTWWSPPTDGLYSSFLVYPGRQPGGLVSLLVGVAVAEAIRRETKTLKPGLKWPNDILVGQKKCTGILVEAGSLPQAWAVIGIGVNVEGRMPPEFSHATTLAESLGGTVDRVSLFAQIADRLERWYETWLTRGEDPILAAWRDASITLNHPVRVMKDGQVLFGGRARDIDGDGALLVDADDGSLRRVEAGEVSLRFEDGDYHPSITP